MPRLDREQAISVAVLALLLLVSVSVAGMSFQARSDAVREISERREMLSRLEAKLRTISSRPTAVPPPAAFLDASTQALPARSCKHISGDWPTISASLVSSGEKLPTATTHPMRSDFRPRLI